MSNLNSSWHFWTHFFLCKESNPSFKSILMLLKIYTHISVAHSFLRVSIIWKSMSTYLKKELFRNNKQWCVITIFDLCFQHYLTSGVLLRQVAPSLWSSVHFSAAYRACFSVCLSTITGEHTLLGSFTATATLSTREPGSKYHCKGYLIRTTLLFWDLIVLLHYFSSESSKYIPWVCSWSHFAAEFLWGS